MREVTLKFVLGLLPSVFLLLVFQSGNSQYFNALNGQCDDRALYYYGTCRQGACPASETFLPGVSYCELYDSYYQAAFVRCAATIPCCVWGGTCRQRCNSTENTMFFTTDCTSTQTSACCVARGSSIGNPATVTPQSTIAQRQGQCGSGVVLQRRILGGRPALPTSWPGMVKLIYGGSVHGVCAGVLVDDDTVIIVAHCVSSTPSNQIQVLLGDYNTSLAEPGEEFVNVRSVELNTNYVAGTRGNDFAVLKLARPVTFSQTVLPACLPDPTIPLAEPNECYVSGWGVTETGQVSDVLRSARVTLLEADLCNAIVTSAGNTSPLGQDMLCTDTARTNTDACLFDDGGLLACRDQTGRYQLIGLVAEYSCGSLPTMYTRVDNYTESILARL